MKLSEHTTSVLKNFASINQNLVIKEGKIILEIGGEGDRIVDFQSGNYAQREILEMFSSEPKE